MKYFRVVNPDDVTDEFYVSCDRDYDGERAKEFLGLWQYWITECTKEEFETMTQDQNDYILNVGQTQDELTPFASAFTKEDAIELAKEAGQHWKCVEVVYMPVDNDDINEIVWSQYK